MSQTKIIVHKLICDICDDSIEDFGECFKAKDMRNWAKNDGWGFHSGKDYCSRCEKEYHITRIKIANI